MRRAYALIVTSAVAALLLLLQDIVRQFCEPISAMPTHAVCSESVSVCHDDWVRLEDDEGSITVR